MTAAQPPSAAKPPFWAGLWYFVITILSAGLLAWVPFVHAASRLRRRLVTLLAGVYAILAATEVALLSLTPTETQPQTTGSNAISIMAGLLPPAIVAVGCVQQVWLRREVYCTTPGRTTTEPALEAALAARARRTTARQLATTDPLVARDLRIGRPDLPRTYDDGGLVDLNSAPAALIAQTCGLTVDVANSIVTARSESGGFLTVDDVFAMTEIPINAWDVIRDRSVVIPALT